MTILDKLLDMGRSPMLMAPERCQQFFTAIERLQAGKIEKRTDIMAFLFGHHEEEKHAREGVAVISVMGTLTHRKWWTNNYLDIGERVKVAIEDASIKHIILDIDSHGGVADGVFDLAETLFNARREKPITAIVADNANSAAYLIASAANEIVVSQTSDVGSVGVVATHTDYSGFFKKEGIVHTHVFAGEHKVDGSPYNPLSDEMKAQLQEEVDLLYSMFTEAVARYRGLSVDTVVETQAQIYTGQQAIDIGFADTLAPYDAAMSKVLASVNSSISTPGVKNMSTEPKQQETEAPKPAANADEMALIADACDKAGAGYLTAGFIRDSASMEQVQSRLEEVEKIRTACKLPVGVDDKAAKKLSDTYIRQGLSLEEVQGRLLDRLANNDEETLIDSTSKPDQKSLDNNTKGIADRWDRSFKKTGATLKAS